MAEIDDIVAECRKNLKLSVDAEGNNRADAVDDLKFASGDQWPADIATARDLANRPCLTINKTDTYIRQVVNNMRQQRPRMVVHPVNDGADEELSEVVQGMLRHIEVNSNAEFAYDTAADFQVRMGWGYWRVNTRYIDEQSFDQDIFIDAVKNPFTVYLDPSSEMPDGSDAQWAIVTDTMKRKDFKEKYPKASDISFSYKGQGDDFRLWANKTEIRVAEYFRVEHKADKLCRLSDGSIKFRSDLPDDDILRTMNISIVQERESFKRVVMWYKMTAVEILEKREWAGKYIPIIPVYGAELNVDGKIVRYGMTRMLKDPQRMYNYWRTSETEVVALAPKAPWLVAEGQIEGYEDVWNTANVQSYSYLPYKPVDNNGQPVPPPIRQQPQGMPQGQVNAAMGAAEDLKAVSGIFDASLGANGNETSGVAINNRQQQSDMSNFHFYDNLTRSIRWTGKIILDLIPKIYDTQRVVRIIGEDGNPESITINEKQYDEQGSIQQVLNDVTIGQYDIVMDTGPGYQTKREEAAAHMTEMFKAWPQLAQVAGDIIVRQFDWHGAREIADRLAAVNPLAKMDENSDLPPQAQVMINALKQQLQQIQGQYQQLELEKKAKLWGDEQWQQTEIKKEEIRASASEKNAHLNAATKIHDTNTRAATARDVEEIRGMVDLLLEHLHIPKRLSESVQD